ncbi:MAG: DUF3467 domain-containing protein [Chloroflexi bacterium]|nr:DUF3467 domain-containing protein [Chloroflexota bacterium]
MQPPIQPSQKRISIEIPKELEPVYANIAFITHTPAEVILDLAQVMPRLPNGKVVSRIIMSPIHAKSLLHALSQNLATYEQQYGEIRMPTMPHIADQFFRFPNRVKKEMGGGVRSKK